MNIFEALHIIRDFQRLSELISVNDVGTERRWQSLQAWLADHPKYRNKLYHCLKLSPPDAVRYLCEQFGIDLDELQGLDPNGAMIAQAERTVGDFQSLYKQRAMTTKGEVTNG